MKRVEALSVGQIIQQALEQSHLSDTFREQQACYLWGEVVGPGVNRYTTRRYVSHGELHVYLSSAPLKNELAFMRSRIVDDINARVGANVITSLVIH